MVYVYDSPCATFFFLVVSRSAVKIISNITISSSMPVAADTAISNNCAELSVVVSTLSSILALAVVVADAVDVPTLSENLLIVGWMVGA